MRLEDRRKRHNTYLSWLAIAALLAIFIWLAHAVWGVFTKEQIAGAKMKEAEERLQKLEVREEALFQKVEDMETPRGVEAELREKYGVAREGEHVVIIAEDKPSNTSSASSQGIRSWWKAIKGWFIPNNSN